MQNRLFRSECNGFGRPRLRSSAPGNRLIWCLVPWLVFGLTACTATEVDIRFVNGGGREPTIQPVSGWPLTLSLTANEGKLLGIWTYRQGIYPELGHAGALVFEDPDGCPSWVSHRWQEKSRADILVSKVPTYPACEAPPDMPWPKDETVLHFKPGMRPDPQECSDEPYLLTFEEVDGDVGVNTQRTPIGPCVASGADGYGPNPRLPGLVVVADAGLGVVTDEEFDPLPRTARNLAGLFQSVAYELKDSRGQVSILAHLNVPEALFSPVVLVDQIVPGECDDDGWIRVDGGPDICPTDRSDQIVTIRAFVVNDRAPDELADLNDDGVVDIVDAIKAGLRPLSRQVIFRLAPPPDQRLYKDLNDDKRAKRRPPVVLPPADPGSIEEPPP